MQTPRRSHLALILLLGLAACGGGGGAPAPAGPGGPGPGGPNPTGVTLSRPEDCDELRVALIADAREKIAVQADRLRTDGLMVIQDPRVVDDLPGAPAPSPSEGEQPPGDFTDTNVQVPGVDEADTVETDGTRLFVLHGSELMVLAAWPPEATALDARVAIEGSPQAMFVSGDRAAVFSWVYDDGDLAGDSVCPAIGYPMPEPLIGAPALDVALICVPTFTKLTLIDLAATPPRVAREIYLEGGYVGARRHGNQVRVVVQRSWGVPPGVPEPWSTIWGTTPPANQADLIARVDAWEADAQAALEASTLAEWLPSRKERRDGALVDVPPTCADVHLPPPALAQEGATRILSLDMSQDDGATRETMVMGFSSQIYASSDTLLLSQPEWGWFERGEENDQTAVHVFALSDTDTSYVASGFIPGMPINQFAYDVQGGVIRVASTLTKREILPGGPVTASRVTTARVDGDGLALIGATEDLAPGERIFSSRFIGDTAYVVTFRQIDPLFVIDLADPADPRVLGEVEIPGFSEYIHPLGENHLLTIGKDADLEGRVLGAALRVFDVSNPAAPAMAHLHRLPGEGWSPAEYDHLAFTFDATRGILALPYSRYDGPYRSSLVLVDVDTAAGFSERGEVTHDASGDPCPPRIEGTDCSGPPEMRRGIFIQDWVYSVSGAGVAVHAIDDLSTRVASVSFPPEFLPTPLE